MLKCSISNPVHSRNHPKNINPLAPNRVIFHTSLLIHGHLFSESLGLCCPSLHPATMMKSFSLRSCQSGGPSSCHRAQGAATGRRHPPSGDFSLPQDEAQTAQCHLCPAVRAWLPGGRASALATLSFTSRQAELPWVP